MVPALIVKTGIWVKPKLRRVRRFGGRILDLLTYLDHVTADSKCKLITSPNFESIVRGKSLAGTIIVFGFYAENVIAFQTQEKFISDLSRNFKILPCANVETVSTFKPSWILRENLGRDLSLLRDICRTYRKNFLGHNLVWINSSCHWDTLKLTQIINDLERTEANEVVGMTDSWLGGHHIQTYFVFIPVFYLEECLNLIEAAFSRNWRFKRTLVNLGERRFSKYLEIFGINWRVLFSAKEFDSKNYKFINTYSDYSSELGAKGFPGYKLKK